MQPSGSFKSRGIGHLISKQSKSIMLKNDGRKPHVYASSGGNAGLAAATASKMLNIPCTVVVPDATKKRMVNKIRAEGANVIVKGAVIKQADEYLKECILPGVDANLIKPIYVHPYDNPDIWDGHSSIVDEMLETLISDGIDITKQVKGIVCSIGGGGLYNGIVQGLERYNLAKQIPILGVETHGTHAFNQSLKAGYRIELDKITSIATSLGTPSISEKTLEYAIKYDTRSVVLSDFEVVKTCLEFTETYNIVTEPACGAALHMGYNIDLLEHTLGTSLGEDDIILIIACGGSSNGVDDLKAFYNRYDTSVKTVLSSMQLDNEDTKTWGMISV